MSQKVRKRKHLKKGDVNYMKFCQEVNDALLLWFLETDDDPMQTGTLSVLLQKCATLW